jgi:hypothetical protein
MAEALGLTRLSRARLAAIFMSTEAMTLGMETLPNEAKRFVPAEHRKPTKLDAVAEVVAVLQASFGPVVRMDVTAAGDYVYFVKRGVRDD